MLKVMLWLMRVSIWYLLLFHDFVLATIPLSVSLVVVEISPGSFLFLGVLGTSRKYLLICLFASDFIKIQEIVGTVPLVPCFLVENWWLVLFGNSVLFLFRYRFLDSCNWAHCMYPFHFCTCKFCTEFLLLLFSLVRFIAMKVSFCFGRDLYICIFNVLTGLMSVIVIFLLLLLLLPVV